MGSSGSRLRGCCSAPRCDSYDGRMGLQFSEPLDEGLGHSFCYVRPQPYGSPPLVTPDKSEEFLPLSNGGKHGPVMVGPDDSGVDGTVHLISSKDDKEDGHNEKGKQSVVDRPRLSSEKPKNGTNDKIKIGAETSFKAISGASVSANTATPRTVMSSEQFNSFSNIIYDRAAAFESSSSFSAIPLQPVPRGFSGPLSGPLDRGERVFMSGPLERERGFMSGPLERGFMSGPLERGSISGPLDSSVDRSHFSAPLNSSFHHYGGYFRRRRKSLVQFMTSISGPLKKAMTRTASSLAKTHKSFVSPVRSYIFTRERNKEANYDAGEKGKWKGAVDPIDSSLEFSGTELEMRASDNLQWAQGKAGEDRVHVVISEEQGWIFVGIYDGFNGPDAPDFLMSNLYPAVSQELQGLLWDLKEESSSPASGGEEIREENKESTEGEGVGQRPVDRGEQVLDWWRSQRAEGDVTQLQRQQVELGVRNVGRNQTGSSNGQEMKEYKSPIEENGGSEKDMEEGKSPIEVHGASKKNTKEDLKEDKAPIEVNGASEKGTKQDLKEDKARTEVDGASQNDIPRLSSDDIKDRESQDRTCELEHESQIPRGPCAAPEGSRTSSERLCSPSEECSCLCIGQEEEEQANVVKLGGVEGRQRFVTETEGELAEDCGPGQLDEVENERSSDMPEFSEASSVSEQDHNNVKKRSSPGMRHRHGHNRRNKQLRKYFQWRYEDQEHAGAVQKVKNAKVAQDPDSPGTAKAVEHASVLKALARALENTENAYLDMADKVLYENPELALMGSCVLVMLMKDEDMYILNVGDSRAILAQHPKVEPVTAVLGGKGAWSDSGARDSLLRLELERIIEETPMELEALESPFENGGFGAPCPSEPSLLGALQLTTDHSTSIKEEVLRLRAEHPDDDTIENDRVKGKLKVTRAFGAGFLKQPKWNNALLEMFQINFIGTTPYITCSPALYHHRLGPQDEFLVLSSDGLYQYFSNEEVVSHVEWFMKKFPDGDPAQHLIEELLFRAAKKAGMDFHELLDIPQGDRRKYHDDVSVMVISLEGRIWRSSG